jgi:hypothetical protein
MAVTKRKPSRRPGNATSSKKSMDRSVEVARQSITIRSEISAAVNTRSISRRCSRLINSASGWNRFSVGFSRSLSTAVFDAAIFAHHSQSLLTDSRGVPFRGQIFPKTYRVSNEFSVMEPTLGPDRTTPGDPCRDFAISHRVASSAHSKVSNLRNAS